MVPWIPLWLPWVAGALVGLACLTGAFFALWRKRLIDDLPTSKARGVFIGLCELKGTAESDSPLTGYLSGVHCVHHDWTVEEHWSRTVHETYRDAQGHTQTRTRTETGWTRVAGDIQSVPFYLRDDTGVIRVLPPGASITGVSTFNASCSRHEPLYFGKGPAREIANTTHRRRFRETAIPLHTQLYVMGQARERADVVAAEVAHDKDAAMFLISTQTEKQVSASYAAWFAVWVFLGGMATASAAGFGWALGSSGATGFSWMAFVMGAIAFLFALGIGWGWMVYNSLIGLRQRVRQGWSQVDVLLKRRHDLIPNLVKAVEGYRVHETGTQELVAEIRARGEARGGESRGAAPVLRMVAEQYPELRASEAFAGLRQALVDAEQRIALARDYFNNIATFYNTRLAIVPDRFVARLAGLRPAPLMSARDFERAPLEVSFAD